MKNNRSFKLIGIGLLFLFLLFTIVKYYYHSFKLENEYKYTIASITQCQVNARLGEDVYYKFKQKDSVIKNKENIYLDYYGLSVKSLVGRRFLVKYQQSNPNNCKILLDFKVKEGIVAPINGWDSIPKVK